MERLAAEPAALLEEARAAGLTVTGDGDRLVVRGPTSRRDLADRLLADRPGVLAVLAEEWETEVAWRVAVMAPQIPATGTIPLLVGWWSCDSGPDDCLSCGDVMEEGQQYRCRACAEAARRVVAADEEARTARRGEKGANR